MKFILRIFKMPHAEEGNLFFYLAFYYPSSLPLRKTTIENNSTTKYTYVKEFR